MSVVTGKNALAMLLSSLATPVIGLLMIPFYLRKIGLEGLGLIGFLTLLTSVLGLFVSGASKTFQRDLSHAQEVSPEDLSGLLKGGMIFFGLLALSLGGTVLAVGFSQIHRIAEGSSFSNQTLQRCLLLIGLLLAMGVFSGAMSMSLSALRDQVWVSGQNVVMGFGVAVATWLSLNRWPAVDVFYSCQVAGAAVGLLLTLLRLRWFSKRISGRVPQRTLKKVWKGKTRQNGKLAGLLVVHEGMGMIVTQIDRMLVTTLFPLSALGAYNLAANPGRMTGILTAPINTVTYPELCRLVGMNASKHIVGEYIARITFIICLLFAGVMIMLISSGHELLSVWIGASRVPVEAPLCLVFLSAGHLLLAMAGPFYNLSVAYGRVGYSIPLNIAAVLLLPPLGYFTTSFWGISGAALIWLIYGFFCVLVCMIVVFSRYGDVESGKRWLWGCLSCITGAAFLSLALDLSPLEGWQRIMAALLTTLCFTVLFLIHYFGCRIRSWLHIMEIKAPPLIDKC